MAKATRTPTRTTPHPGTDATQAQEGGDGPAAPEAGAPATAGEPSGAGKAVRRARAGKTTAAPRRGRKLAAVVAMLEGQLGASLGQLQELTGWKPHSVRAALSGLRKAGLRIEGSREGSTVRLYRIVGPMDAADHEEERGEVPATPSAERLTVGRASRDVEADPPKAEATSEDGAEPQAGVTL